MAVPVLVIAIIDRDGHPSLVISKQGVPLPRDGVALQLPTLAGHWVGVNLLNLQNRARHDLGIIRIEGGEPGGEPGEMLRALSLIAGSRFGRGLLRFLKHDPDEVERLADC
jgi:hypothetical protein